MLPLSLLLSLPLLLPPVPLLPERRRWLMLLRPPWLLLPERPLWLPPELDERSRLLPGFPLLLRLEPPPLFFLFIACLSCRLDSNPTGSAASRWLSNQVATRVPPPRPRARET
jgi:hypothetical protein